MTTRVFLALVLINLCTCFETDPAVTEKLHQLEARLEQQEEHIQRLEAANKAPSRCIPCGTDTSPDHHNLRSVRKATRQAETVAFSAFLDHDINQLGIDHPLVYNQVIYNQGNVYNPHSGIFTCPMDGVYVIYFSVSTSGRHQIVAKLVVDGANTVDAVSDTVELNHEAQGSNLVVTGLKQGQQVWVSNYRWGNQTINDSNTYRFATFSAFMLY